MFAKDWGGGDGPRSAPAPAGPPRAISRDLLAICDEGTRRAERLVQQIDPTGPRMHVREAPETLGWAIRALEQVADSDSGS